ncbi:MAG: hypothetical protein M3N14_09710 [Bacteroidota bacterium]|nr:hypothetical protein [Bacteroidota bacterium]
MKSKLIIFFSAIAFLLSCKTKTEQTVSINGTWQLITGTTITKGVSAVTDYTKNQRMIKIINDTHFSFLKHDLHAAKDSSNHFDAGGGRYTLTGGKYTEHLDYYSDKNWEGKPFTFTLSLKGDTLIQTGLEKVEKENIDRTIIEKYVRVKE